MNTSQSQRLDSTDQNVCPERVDLTITDAIPIDITVLAADGEVLTSTSMLLIALDSVRMM